ncbi:glycosyltransferase [Candidatus Pelagibacter sp.]|nr:glycosyltransferase [Candidatus Pelagibacter sp.]MDC1483492.1 glycosyltransferase [Pelagibacteraceae bacterium]
MKILYISKSIIPSRTANSIHVMKMCQAFADNGHEVVLLAPDVKNHYEKDIEDIYEYYGTRKNFTIKKLYHPNQKFGAFLYTLAIFFYLFINKKFDLVYGRFLHGVYVATWLNNKVIYESHAPTFDKKNHRLIVFKNLIKSKYFIKMVVISEALKNMYLEKRYLSNTKIQIAHDGADEVVNFDRKINLLGHKENLKVGYVGHLYKGKGMEVIALLANKLDDDIEIHIIGGLEKDIKFWKSKINSKNIFFYGFIPHQEISSYINALDICLLPNQKIVLAHGSESSKEFMNISDFTSPLKLFEYMSHRKAIIASDLPVIREVLNEKNSILLKCDDIDLWINSIKNLKNLKNRDLIANQALSDFYNYSWKNRALLVLKF